MTDCGKFCTEHSLIYKISWLKEHERKLHNWKKLGNNVRSQIIFKSVRHRFKNHLINCETFSWIDIFPDQNWKHRIRYPYNADWIWKCWEKVNELGSTEIKQLNVIKNFRKLSWKVIHGSKGYVDALQRSNTREELLELPGVRKLKFQRKNFRYHDGQLQ